MTPKASSSGGGRGRSHSTGSSRGTGPRSKSRTEQAKSRKSRPAQPTASPPSRLQQAKKEVLHHPKVARAGVTTTRDGRWALKVWLCDGVEPPLPELEEKCKGVPIVYDREPEKPPVARPAFPARDE